MAERKPPRGDPLGMGFTKIPDGGGGMGWPRNVSRGPLTKTEKSNAVKAVGRAARAEVTKITTKTKTRAEKDRRADRTKIQEMSGSHYWENKGLASVPAEIFGRETVIRKQGRKHTEGLVIPTTRGANDQGKGKSSQGEIIMKHNLQVEGNPFKSDFMMKMNRGIKTRFGHIHPDNENIGKKKK